MKISSDHNFIMDMKNKIVPINKIIENNTILYDN